MTRSPWLRRALASLLASVVVTTLGVGTLGGPATAEPGPTLRQVQRQVEVLNHQAEQATERYNTARVALRESERELKAVRSRFDRQRQSFDEMRVLVGRLAAARYMSGSIDTGVALLFSENPTTFLRQAADLEQLGQQQGALLRRMATVRLRLTQDRLALRQQRSQAAAIEAKLTVERRSVQSRLRQARSLLTTLAAPQRVRLVEQRQAAEVRALDTRDQVMRASRDAREGTFPTDDGPASGRAADAVRSAYAQLGDPYVWAAGGPNAFDCSGLTMYAWRAQQGCRCRTPRRPSTPPCAGSRSPTSSPVTSSSTTAPSAMSRCTSGAARSSTPPIPGGACRWSASTRCPSSVPAARDRGT